MRWAQAKTTWKISRRNAAAWPSLGCALLSLAGAPALAATPGTQVANTATVSFDSEGATRTVASNTATLILAERLDVSVVADAPTLLAPDTGAANAVRFRVSNGGNGTETFSLIGGIEGEGALAGLAADEDGNGAYDPAIDRPLPAHGPGFQLTLAAGEGAGIFVLVGGARIGGKVSLAATAATGAGAPGTLLPGLGDGGGDAFVGQTGASAAAFTTFAAGAPRASLVKSQSVRAPDGSSRAVRDAIVTYTLEARFPAAVGGAVIGDPIPAGTAYVPGSLTLEGGVLTDAADADAGRIENDAIAVALGDISAAGIRTVRFQVKIL